MWRSIRGAYRRQLFNEDMMICPKCKSMMLWNSDFSFEDYGYEEDGIVGSYTCIKEKCDVDMVHIYTPLSDEV